MQQYYTLEDWHFCSSLETVYFKLKYISIPRSYIHWSAFFFVFESCMTHVTWQENLAAGRCSWRFSISQASNESRRVASLNKRTWQIICWNLV